jgi:hypothetical protein
MTVYETQLLRNTVSGHNGKMRMVHTARIVIERTNYRLSGKVSVIKSPYFTSVEGLRTHTQILTLFALNFKLSQEYIELTRNSTTARLQEKLNASRKLRCFMTSHSS